MYKLKELISDHLTEDTPVNPKALILAGAPGAEECKKIDKRVNKRKLSEIKTKEVPHILKVFNF